MIVIVSKTTGTLTVSRDDATIVAFGGWIAVELIKLYPPISLWVLRGTWSPARCIS